MSSEPTETDPQGPDTDARLCTPSDVAAQYERHQKMLHEVAGRFFNGKRPDAAQDAVMYVFTHLVEVALNGRLTDKGDRWRPYLWSAVQRNCIDIVRRETKDRERFPAGDPRRERITDVDPIGDGLAADDQARRQMARLGDALATLDEDQLTIIKNAFWDGWTNRKIGQSLGISGQAVGQRLKTVIKKLHEEVTRDD